MRRCEDEKMFYRPPLLEEPCAQTLSGKRCRWLKVIKTNKNIGKTGLENQKKHWKKQKKQKEQFSESLGWDPPSPKSLEILLFFQGFFFVVFQGFCRFFQGFFGFCRFFQGFSQVWGTARKLA